MPSLEGVVLLSIYAVLSIGWIFVKHRQNRLALAGLALAINLLLLWGLVFIMGSGFD
jgi:hypothetical protein